jgi:cell shape-determining protein MreD
MEMLSTHFNKQVFINTLKTKHVTTYLSTTIALMVILALHGMLQGNLKPEFFLYAFIASLAFALWNLVDHKYRKFQKAQHLD